MFERFTAAARESLVLAQEAAHRLGHTQIGTEHVLCGLLQMGSEPAALALESLGIDYDAAVDAIRKTRPPGGPPVSVLNFTPHALRAIELALREALALGQTFIGGEHLLLGLIREGDGTGVRVLGQLGVTDLGRIREAVLRGMEERGTVPASVPADGRGQDQAGAERRLYRTVCRACEGIGVIYSEHPERSHRYRDRREQVYRRRPMRV